MGNTTSFNDENYRDEGLNNLSTEYTFLH